MYRATTKNVTNIPAKKKKADAIPRVPKTETERGGQKRYKTKANKKKEPPYGVIIPVVSKKHKLPIRGTLRKRHIQRLNRFFTLKVFPPQASESRIGVIVSAKIEKRAVKRNTLKRIIFEFFTNNRDRIPLGDFLVIVRPPAARTEKRELVESLSSLFARRQ